MRKTIILMALLTVSVAAMALTDNDEINRQWRKAPITVKNGGKSPDIITLLTAFHQKWPTYAVSEVLKHAPQLKDGQQYESDDDWRVLVNRRNGYADLSSNTDIDQMEACVWRRANGHRLFAVSLYQQHVMPQNLLCWYDYDPATQTLRPEASPVDEYKPNHKSSHIGWSLPMEGTDLQISEHFDHWQTGITHIYKWDGTRHHYSRSQINDFRYQWFAEDDWYQASEQGFSQYALLDPQGNGFPLLCLSKAKTDPSDADEYTIFAQFKGDMQTVAISDVMHQINGLYSVKPEADAQWKSTDLVAYTSDEEHIGYYAVVREGFINYFVIDRPFEDDGETGHQPEVIGYGSDDESIHIIHASIAQKFAPQLQWHNFEFIEEEP